MSIFHQIHLFFLAKFSKTEIVNKKILNSNFVFAKKVVSHINMCEQIFNMFFLLIIFEYMDTCNDSKHEFKFRSCFVSFFSLQLNIFSQQKKTKRFLSVNGLSHLKMLHSVFWDVWKRERENYKNLWDNFLLRILPQLLAVDPVAKIYNVAW